jgi:hypothetical protein
MKTNECRFYAYARGYNDGRHKGAEDDSPWFTQNIDPEIRRKYREGYERGVADFCEDTYPEEI